MWMAAPSSSSTANERVKAVERRASRAEFGLARADLVAFTNPRRAPLNWCACNKQAGAYDAPLFT